MKHGTMKTGARKIACMGAVIALLFLVQGISMGAVLEATPDHVEFGTVDEGDPVVALSEIVNTGDTPVEITNVRTT
jgi:hypothetical protein